ncbi:MAG: glutamate 5-kinase [Polyangiaceae bacterium]|nr:glutamate 5-kinase [Polyangiaceae bacterium]
MHDEELPLRLAEQFAHARQRGISITLVSSGATALGMQRLGMTEKPSERSAMQAAASAGQSLLMRRYDQVFAAKGIVTAQVLLTHGDLANRGRVNNARAALASLLNLGAIPIINENDAIATDELSFTDNDQLAAMVAPLIGADALILLTDVEGVLDAEGNRISLMENVADFEEQDDSRQSVGRGGMGSKLNAAHKGRRSGAAVIIADARDERVIEKILDGEDVGTVFPALSQTLRARKHWIAYALRTRGRLIIDEGAVKALTDQSKSLLPVGVIGISGEFRRGDAVKITTSSGKEIGRGLTRLTSPEAARAAGKKGKALVDLLGSSDEAVVIHRDDLVLWPTGGN